MKVSTTTDHKFRFDQVYGSRHGRDPSLLYREQVLPLVDGLFRGYNGEDGLGGERRAITPLVPRCWLFSAPG